MNSFVIVYDVSTDAVPVGTKTSADVYAALYEAIKSYNGWAHVTESCWIVVSDNTAVQIRDSLRLRIRSCDRLAVIQTAHVAAWSNVLCDGTWLQNNL